MIIQFAQKYKGKFIDKPLEKNGKGARLALLIKNIITERQAVCQVPYIQQ